MKICIPTTAVVLFWLACVPLNVMFWFWLPEVMEIDIGWVPAESDVMWVWVPGCVGCIVFSFVFVIIAFVTVVNANDL